MESNRKSRSGLRSLTRLFALQSLYRLQFKNETLEQILKESENGAEIAINEDLFLREIDFGFFKNLMSRCQNNIQKIDESISKCIAKNWSFERLDKVMQSLLRLGACEILFFEDIPDVVTFNEYIEIAKAFFEKNETSFINGVLNSISKSKENTEN